MSFGFPEPFHYQRSL